MRRLIAAFSIALASCAGPTFLPAQSPDYTHVIARVDRVEIISHHLDFNPIAMAFDPVWTNGYGWRMPRIAWHAMYPLANAGIKRGTVWTLEAVRVPPRAAETIGWTVAFTGLTLLPHARQMAIGLRNDHTYQLNACDWIFDWHNRDMVNWRDAGHLGRWAALDVLLSPCARP